MPRGFGGLFYRTWVSIKLPTRGVKLMTFLRIIGWIFVTISAIFILSLSSIFVPCLIGEPNSCISGILLLGGIFFVLVFGLNGLLLLTITRQKKN